MRLAVFAVFPRVECGGDVSQLIVKPLDAVSLRHRLDDLGLNCVAGLLLLPGGLKLGPQRLCLIEVGLRVVQRVASFVDVAARPFAVADLRANLETAFVRSLPLCSKLHPGRAAAPALLTAARVGCVHPLLCGRENLPEHRVLGQRLQRLGQAPLPRLVWVLVEPPGQHGGDGALLGQ